MLELARRGRSIARAAHARRSLTFVAYAIRLNAEKVTKGHTQSSMGPGEAAKLSKLDVCVYASYRNVNNRRSARGGASS